MDKINMILENHTNTPRLISIEQDYYTYLDVIQYIIIGLQSACLNFYYKSIHLI